jgi:hypothetical protein
MKFLNIKTKLYQIDIDEITFNMSMHDAELINHVYSNIDYVEYTDNDDFECMFCSIDDYNLSKILDFYNKLQINYEVIDLTKEVFFDISFPIIYENQYKRDVTRDIINLISEFKFNYTDVDVVLDKINEMGIKSLTDFDKSVLEKF